MVDFVCFGYRENKLLEPELNLLIQILILVQPTQVESRYTEMNAVSWIEISAQSL